MFNTHPRCRIAKAAVARYVRSVLRSERKPNAEIAVVFFGSRACRRMNRRYLGHDEPTDVISFPLGGAETVEGEVYVNIDRARAQARTYVVAFGTEIARLVVHGTLHLVGYDDRTPRAAARMKNTEDACVRRFCSP